MRVVEVNQNLRTCYDLNKIFVWSCDRDRCLFNTKKIWLPAWVIVLTLKNWGLTEMKVNNSFQCSWEAGYPAAPLRT